ncbi:MAG: DNA polymerase III subunit epsilon [Thiogranum sp.]|nr:DNA polymerase III subunit epsilon [Thiogranum sp.]
MRQIVLDTETTGLDPRQGHRIIEIGCVELINRRLTGNNFHQYLQPEREIDAGAMQVHGISNEFLADKPLFREVVDEFMSYVGGAQLIIHNAPFDVGFLNHELLQCQFGKEIPDLCAILDTLALARTMHPGQKNNLDALCRRYEIDNSRRDLHGALLDAEILADVYLAMTGGQVTLSLGGGPESHAAMSQAAPLRRLPDGREQLRIIRADDDELAAHRSRIDAIARSAGIPAIWEKFETTN